MARLTILCAILLSFCVTSATAVAGLSPADVFARVRPAVVTIVTYDGAGKELAQGSGFIAKPDGSIVTCFHVISGATKVKIFRHSGASWTAQGLVAWDEAQDIAVLKVSGRDLPTIPLGDSDKVRQGDKILAIGSPLGLEETASDGMVSALRGTPDTPKLLQISTPISPGSSGGPILNLEGRVLGIASFVLVEGQNLNFAVPVNSIKTKLVGGGKVTPFTKAKHGNGRIADELARARLTLPGDENSPDAPKKLEAALKIYQMILEKHKDCASAHLGVGYCMFRLGRYQEAVDSYKEAIRLGPDVSAHFLLGLAYSALHRYQQAVASFEEDTRLRPDHAEAHHYMGIAYLSLKRNQEAAGSFREAIRLKSDFVQAHFNLGLAYSALEHYQDAADSFKEAIRLKPDDAEAHFFLGAMYAILDDMGGALDEYKILKNLDAEKAASLFKLIYP